MKPINCLLLAGGMSSRMGEDKASLLFGVVTLLEYLVTTLKNIEGVNAVIICSSNSEHNVSGAERIDDLYPNCGPIGGIVSGLMHSDTDYNWVVSCDTPFVAKILFDALCANALQQSVVLPVYDGQIHYTLGLYAKSLAPLLIQQILQKDFRLKAISAITDTLTVDLSHLDERVFLNLNTPVAYTKALKYLENEKKR